MDQFSQPGFEILGFHFEFWFNNHTIEMKYDTPSWIVIGKFKQCELRILDPAASEWIFWHSAKRSFSALFVSTGATIAPKYSHSI